MPVIRHESAPESYNFLEKQVYLGPSVQAWDKQSS